MKELDLLKKDWKKNANSFEQVTESDIYKMLHQKSSSIVKWLFIISIIEFVFWTVIYVYQNDANYHVKLRKYGVEELMFWINAFNYVVLIVFIYLFYKNHKTISTTDTDSSIDGKHSEDPKNGCVIISGTTTSCCLSVMLSAESLS